MVTVKTSKIGNPYIKNQKPAIRVKINTGKFILILLYHIFPSIFVDVVKLLP